MTVYRLSTQPDGMPRINLLLIEQAGKFQYFSVTKASTRCASTSASAASRLHKGGSAGSPQTRLSWDRPDSRAGGDAVKG